MKKLILGLFSATLLVMTCSCEDNLEQDFHIIKTSDYEEVTATDKTLPEEDNPPPGG